MRKEEKGNDSKKWNEPTWPLSAAFAMTKNTRRETLPVGKRKSYVQRN